MLNGLNIGWAVGVTGGSPSNTIFTRVSDNRAKLWDGSVNGTFDVGALTASTLRSTQTTPPTCSANCGTSPAVAGGDSGGIVTMGATGVPTSGWVLTFNGTWAAAPSCSVTPALAGMAVGKLPIVVATTTTTITVTTNGTAPSTSDKYAYTCIGVQ